MGSSGDIAVTADRKVGCQAAICYREVFARCLEHPKMLIEPPWDTFSTSKAPGVILFVCTHLYKLSDPITFSSAAQKFCHLFSFLLNWEIKLFLSVNSVLQLEIQILLWRNSKQNISGVPNGSVSVSLVIFL